MDPANFVCNVAVSLIHFLVGEITDAFSCHTVLAAFKALDPRDFPTNTDELPASSPWQGVPRNLRIVFIY